jgi:hypothetical protein
MLMKFTIEQRHLTDTDGRPVTDESKAVSFHTREAGSADEAVRAFITEDEAEVLGAIMKFPGFQAVATVRRTSGVYTLQVSPSSSNRISIR